MNKKYKKLIAGALVVTSILMINPIGANAAWKQDFNGWWYEYNDGTYPKGKWDTIGQKWYYFYDTGYMAYDAWIDNYYINSDGSMADVVGFDKMRLSTETKNNLKQFYNKQANVIEKVNELTIGGNDYNTIYRNNICGHSSKSQSPTKYDDYIFDLNSNFKRFTAKIGVDDYYQYKDLHENSKNPLGEKGLVRFTIIGDGNILEEKEAKYGEDPIDIDVNIEGFNKLTIRVKIIDGTIWETYYDIMNGQFYFK